MTTITEQLGRVLAGRYRLDAGIGTGASAHVYEAFDSRLGRRVAIKLLHPALVDDDRFLRRLRAEAQAVAALSHPNVLKVFDWGEGEAGPFLVLELLGGGSLQDLLDAGGRLDPAQAASVGAQAARGLAYAHRRGFVHRDVKPGNLLFDEEGGLRVADFGLARALAEAAWTEPAGAVLGTARYASPELAEGRPLDDRSDVYSLALVLYETMAGRVPFGGDTTLATLVARVGAVLPATPELGPLAPILAQAAISEPLARLDAAELADHLELLGRQLPAPGPLPLAGPLLTARRRDAPSSRAVHEAGRSSSGVGTASGPYDGDAEPAWDRPSDSSQSPALRRSSGAVFDGDELDASAVEDEGGAGDASAARAGGSPRARRARPGWRAAASAGLVVLVLAAGAVAVLRFVVYGHDVPQLRGLPIAAARRAVEREGLKIEIAPARPYSSAVAAGSVLRQSPLPGRHERRGYDVRVVLSGGRAPVAVPSVLGKSGSAAVAMLRSAHLNPRVVVAYDETVAPGKVVSADPSSGTVAYGHEVTVTVSRGPAPRTIPGGLAGSSWSKVSAIVTDLRLRPVEKLAYSSTVAAGDVVTTVPASGITGVRVGSAVDVVVSRGPRLVVVPPVDGLSIEAAISMLDARGLAVTEQVGPPNSTYATATDPLAGASVAPGTDVTLYVA